MDFLFSIKDYFGKSWASKQFFKYQHIFFVSRFQNALFADKEPYASAYFWLVSNFFFNDRPFCASRPNSIGYFFNTLLDFPRRINTTDLRLQLLRGYLKQNGNPFFKNAAFPLRCLQDMFTVYKNFINFNNIFFYQF